jgi:HSP20 family protein
MANQERSSGSPTSERESGMQPGAPGSAPGSAGSSTAGGAPSGGARGGAAGAAPSAGGGRSDQERAMGVSREGSPGGVQPGESQGVQPGAQRGGATSRPQPSLLPAFFANPGLMASAFIANPFEFAEAMTREMDRVFETFGPGSTGMLGPAAGSARLGGAGPGTAMSAQPAHRMMGGAGSFTPQMELVRRGNEIVVRADLPGVRPEEVQVEVQEGVLTISGERRNEFEDQRDGFYHSERRYGAFHRAIPLPEGVNEDDIRANFDHGVLEVAIPLRAQPEQRARRIQVQSQSGSAVQSGQRSEQGTTADAGGDTGRGTQPGR